MFPDGVRFVCVHVGVRVKPDQAEGLFAFAVVIRDAGKRSNRDRMIAAENDRKLTGFKYRFNFSRELFARIADLANELEFLVLFRKILRPLESQIAEIPNRVSEPSDALIESRHTQRGWSNIHAGHARAVSQRNPEDCHRFF